MLPSERDELLEQVGRHRATLPIEVTHGGFEVGGVPQHDCVGDQIERAGVVSLGLQAVVADAAGAMEEDGVGSGVSAVRSAPCRGGDNGRRIGLSG